MREAARNHAWPALALAISCGLVGSACAKGLVPGKAYDHALLSFSGIITPRGGLAQAGPHHPIVGLLWTDPLQRTPDVPMPGSWLRSSVSLATADATGGDAATNDTFTIDVFRPPPPEALVDITAPDSGASTQLAIAEIVIVDDVDGDGTFQVSGAHATIAAPERYLAGSIDLLGYVARPFPPSSHLDSTLVPPSTSGYALLNYNCQGQVSFGTSGVDQHAVDLQLQPSGDLPNVRPCRATHWP